MSFVERLLKDNSHVHIQENKRTFVEETIRSLINNGRSMLHVVADFDFTLTVYEKDGIILPSTHGVIEGNGKVIVRYLNLIIVSREINLSNLVARWFVSS
jgi:hypothetical protein